MDERLLTPQEIESAIISSGEDSFYKPSAWLALTEAQDAKTASIVRKEVNKEWVKWIEDNAAYSYFTDGKRITINVAKWQARKKECGL